MSIVLETLAKEYISDVEKVCLLMLKGLNLASKCELIQYRTQHGMGGFYFNGINQYKFHGRGCYFTNDTITIDWDFGYDERWCGLDPWKLFSYIQSNKRSNPFHESRQIKEMFNNLVSDGKMVVKYGLYYYLV